MNDIGSDPENIGSTSPSAGIEKVFTIEGNAGIDLAEFRIYTRTHILRLVPAAVQLLESYIKILPPYGVTASFTIFPNLHPLTTWIECITFKITCSTANKIDKSA